MHNQNMSRMLDMTHHTPLFGINHVQCEVNDIFFQIAILAQVFLLRSLLGAWACCLRLPGVMPLSKEQMDVKDGSTPIQFAKDNPKKVGSKVWDRYEQYKDANSISQATEKKAGWQDVTADFEKGFLKIMEDMDEVRGPTKRPAPEGTPDREAQARTKFQASTLIPRSLPTEIENRGPDLQSGNLGGNPHSVENGYAGRDHTWSVCHGKSVNEQNG